MRSLLVLSLPRSLSTEVHRVCCESLGLQSPAWTTAGEILNLDRFVLQGGQNNAFPKYILPRHGTWFGGATQFLEHAYVAEGFCYKDVVQPFVVSAWSRQGPPRQVLKIKPNIAHVAFAMLQRNWLYPTTVGRQTGSVPAMMVEGLLLAEAALGDVPGDEVAFDDLVFGFSGLEAVLARYGSQGGATAVVLPPDFKRRRDEILGRRSLDLYKRLQDLESEARERIARDGATAAARDASTRTHVA